jgi:hypothetical protein
MIGKACVTIARVGAFSDTTVSALRLGYNAGLTANVIDKPGT